MTDNKERSEILKEIRALKRAAKDLILPFGKLAGSLHSVLDRIEAVEKELSSGS